MAKTLCELKRLLKGDIEDYIKYVDRPSHVCRKCGRVANNKKLVCKPHKIDREELK